MGASRKITAMMQGSSWIRRMFEAGTQLRAEHGADRVFDFSIGNPDVEPPAAFQEALREVAAERVTRKHGYMPNAGYPEVREQVARQVSREQGVEVGAGQVIMSCGAAGGMNAALKAILDPGDQVIVSAPCFAEYGSYVDNHGGTLVTVPTLPDFDLDVAGVEARVTQQTAAVLINSPNNPTGRVYPESTLRALAAALDRCRARTGRTVFLLSDEPYRNLVFDGTRVPGIFGIYPHSMIATSYSKDLSLPGERIGFVAVCPAADEARSIVDGIVLCTRILGFVNAPALMQRVVARLQGQSVDVEIYRRKRDLFYDSLTRMGYRMVKPQGAFYLFPQAPGGDDLAMVSALQEELILVVPGRGFSLPGYFRIAFCVDTPVIERSLAGFERVIRRWGASA
jgi:aspartate aminotransferase